MDKAEARKILEDFLTDQTDEHKFHRVLLPIKDITIMGMDRPGATHIPQYSFRHLLKIVYDLKD
jgi:hypothetical protein